MESVELDSVSGVISYRADRVDPVDLIEVCLDGFFVFCALILFSAMRFFPQLDERLNSLRADSYNQLS